MLHTINCKSVFMVTFDKIIFHFIVDKYLKQRLNICFKEKKIVLLLKNVIFNLILCAIV